MGLGWTTTNHQCFLNSRPGSNVYSHSYCSRLETESHGDDPAGGKGGISPTCCDFRSALLTPAVSEVALFVDVTGTDSVGTNPKGKVLLKYLFLLFTLWFHQTSLQKKSASTSSHSLLQMRSRAPDSFTESFLGTKMLQQEKADPHLLHPRIATT